MASQPLTLSYLNRDSFIHRLTGTAKLVFFFLWSIAVMITYDTRVLVCMLAVSVVLFAVSKIKFSDIRFVAYLALVFLLLNNLFVYLFSPEYGVEIYGTRHLLVQLIGHYTITTEQLFYMFNMTLKIITVIPVALLFITCTNPSEFAASLNSVGISYRVGYAVSIALRYIPDIQREYRQISQAQQARGIDLSGKDKLSTRLKNSAAIIMPLILSSINRIEVISNAMELRGFGKKEKRTWYVLRPFKRNDYLAIAGAILVLTASVAITFYDGSRFYNPFIL
ncbi:MAG: energy-coupling factor transporter transmembrane component T [Oscillospiraceae bacterium]|nr:energy-coupling factor transporter transmembrane component T [Oscillospiraceae bacterium]